MELWNWCQRSMVSLFLILLVPGLLIFSPSTQAQEQEDNSSELPPPTIWIEMDQEEVYADVEPESNGVVSFTGRCYCSFPSIVNDTNYVIVYLRASAGALFISGYPPLIFNNRTEMRTFAFQIQVPKEHIHTDDLWLKLLLDWKYDPSGQKGSIQEEFSFRIVVDRYSRLQINREVIAKRTPVGEWREATLYVQNLGNGNDTVHLEIGSMSKNIDAEMDRELLEVGYGSEAEFHIRLRQRSGSASGNYIRIRAWSDVQGRENETVYEMPFLTKSSFVGFIRTPSQYLPVLSILLIIIILVVWAVLRTRSFPDRETDTPVRYPDQKKDPIPKNHKGLEIPTKGLYKSTRNGRR
ncbi:MAG: hypothetical protein JXA22_08830 [Candidatus Thermoplasmatota archaeon]|nr:hypothetical protein [Candidatus Thermoplasmatota archaeon]